MELHTALEDAISRSQKNDFSSRNGPSVVDAYKQDRLENYLYVITALLDIIDEERKERKDIA